MDLSTTTSACCFVVFGCVQASQSSCLPFPASLCQSFAPRDLRAGHRQLFELSYPSVSCLLCRLDNPSVHSQPSHTRRLPRGSERHLPLTEEAPPRPANNKRLFGALQPSRHPIVHHPSQILVNNVQFQIFQLPGSRGRAVGCFSSRCELAPPFCFHAENRHLMLCASN